MAAGIWKFDDRKAGGFGYISDGGAIAGFYQYDSGAAPMGFIRVP
jgi:hypothetical protein